MSETNGNGRQGPEPRRRPDQRPPRDRPGSSKPRQARIGPIGLRPAGGRDSFELIHPKCVEEAELDYAEGLELWRAGDPDEARDALRYALQACHDNLWVHVALGRIALEAFADADLARGHFGYAVDLVKKSLPPTFRGRIPRDRAANRPFYEAIDGLMEALTKRGQAEDAAELGRWAGQLERGSGPG
ncbi:tetratricopeptide repeat protein [Aquisphaera insulae]|uniref:tetratricopeptide repeat protein n=1 Tax=Aquisphaera insulae TaxID=2712864 RepID=UPI0013E9C7DB|nr:hypothetical protein [Aquisphaera insulae]